MGLPKEGEDLGSYLAHKDNTKMKQKYNLQRTCRGFLIGPIESNMVRFAARILSCKLLHKMRSVECIVGAIEITK